MSPQSEISTYHVTMMWSGTLRRRWASTATWPAWGVKWIVCQTPLSCQDRSWWTACSSRSVVWFLQSQVRSCLQRGCKFCCHSSMENRTRRLAVWWNEYINKHIIGCILVHCCSSIPETTNKGGVNGRENSLSSSSLPTIHGALSCSSPKTTHSFLVPAWGDKTNILRSSFPFSKNVIYSDRWSARSIKFVLCFRTLFSSYAKYKLSTSDSIRRRHQGKQK